LTSLRHILYHKYFFHRREHTLLVRMKTLLMLLVLSFALMEVNAKGLHTKINQERDADTLNMLLKTLRRLREEAGEQARGQGQGGGQAGGNGGSSEITLFCDDGSEVPDRDELVGRVCAFGHDIQFVEFLEDHPDFVDDLLAEHDCETDVRFHLLKAVFDLTCTDECEGKEMDEDCVDFMSEFDFEEPESDFCPMDECERAHALKCLFDSEEDFTQVLKDEVKCLVSSALDELEDIIDDEITLFCEDGGEVPDREELVVRMCAVGDEPEVAEFFEDHPNFFKDLLDAHDCETDVRFHLLEAAYNLTCTADCEGEMDEDCVNFLSEFDFEEPGSDFCAMDGCVRVHALKCLFEMDDFQEMKDEIKCLASSALDELKDNIEDAMAGEKKRAASKAIARIFQKRLLHL